MSAVEPRARLNELQIERQVAARSRPAATRSSALLWSGVLLALFGVLAAAVHAVPALDRLDLRAVHDAHLLALEPLVAWARELTLVGGTHAILAGAGAAVCLLAIMRRWRDALAVAAAVGSTELAVSIVKHLLLRPRPPAADAVAHAAGYSFPSGHAAASVALFGSVAFLALRVRSVHARRAIGSFMAALVVLIGLTRVYLGVHYPTDVAAGWLLGGALTTAAWALPRTSRLS